MPVTMETIRDATKNEKKLNCNFYDKVMFSLFYPYFAPIKKMRL